MVTLKYMNLLLHIDIHRQSVKYIINEQSMNINVFLLFFSFVFLQIERERERERGYIKLGIRRNSPKVYLSFFFWGSSCGESFFFYGLIDFILFLTLAWRKWLLHVSQNFFVFFYPEYLALVLSPTNPVQRLTFLVSYFRWREGVPTSVLGSQPIVWFLPSRVRRPEWGHQV